MTNTKCPQNVDRKRFYVGVSALNHFYWVAGSLIGAFLGKILQSRTNIDFGGIDFALTALFAVLFIERMRNKNVSKKSAENSDEKTANQNEDKINKNDSLNNINIIAENERFQKKNNHDDIFACIIGLICTVISVVLWRFEIIKNSSNILLFSMAAGIFIIILNEILKSRKKN